MGGYRRTVTRWWRGWVWRLVVGVAVAVVAGVAAWSAAATGQPLALVLVGAVTAVVGGFAPLGLDVMAERRRRHREVHKGSLPWQVVEPDESVAWLLHPASKVVP